MVLNTTDMQVQTVHATTPGKVFKGKKHAWSHGWLRKLQYRTLKLFVLTQKRTYSLVKGAVPGPKKALVTIKESVKAGK